LEGAALFPISLSNQHFSTDNALPAVARLFERHEKIVFFVADHLQIYNKAAELSAGQVGALIDDFGSGKYYLDQRRRWVERMVARLDRALTDGKWTVQGVDDVTDSQCFRIFRNVMIAYYSDRAFRADIDGAARTHAKRRGNDPDEDEARELLSRGYLLEEIALSVRLHVTAGIGHEYYLGSQIAAVLKLYSGTYAFDPFDLAEMSRPTAPIRFYFLANTPEGLCWMLYGD
jgi:hypothetical protein